MSRRHNECDEKDSEAWFIETERSSLEALSRLLSLYKLRSQVVLSFLPDWKVYVFWRAGPGEAQAGLTHFEEVAQAVEGNYPDPRLTQLGRRILCSSPLSSDSLLKNGWEEASLEQYDFYRISLGIPHSNDLIPNRSFVLEYGFDELGAVSWTKGCYVGQELMAHMHHRGLVRKRLLPVIIKRIGSVLPVAGSPVCFQKEKVGILKSVCEAESSHKGEEKKIDSREAVGLVHLRLEVLSQLSEGEMLSCEETVLIPTIPFWMKIP